MKEEKSKIPNHEADIKNANKGTKGNNKTFVQNQKNREKQLAEKKQVKKTPIIEVKDFSVVKTVIYPKAGLPSKEFKKESGKKRTTNITTKVPVKKK